VAAHRDRRPAAWSTVETHDVAAVLDAAGPGDAVLVDCLTLWLTEVLDRAGAWADDADPAAVHATVARATARLLAAWRSTPAQVVAVSNEVGSGVVPQTASGRAFRDALGTLNAQVAAASDAVVLTVAGVPVPLRGGAGPHPLGTLPAGPDRGDG
jgi:adenosylcobinamide kinase/adenosylcobinamide-phosphate guanylyltransferase